MGQELTDIDPDEVAIVKRGAIGRAFSIFKSADDKIELAKAVADALNDPIDGEASFLDAIRKSGADEDAQEAIVAAARLLKAFDADLPEAMRIDFSAIAKAKTPEPGDIGTRADLEKAVAAFDGDDAAKQQLIAKATELDATDALPKDWISKSNPTDKEPVMADGLSVPVRKEDGTWDTSGVEDPAARAFYDTVLKSLDDTKAANDKLSERVEKAEGENADLKAQLVERDLVAKAETEFSHVAKAEELTPILKAAKEAFDAETFEKLEDVLKAANAKIETGDLFKEIRDTPAVKDALAKSAALAPAGDAWAKIEELAKNVIEKADGPLTQEQAVDRVLKSEEGRELYAQYLVESHGGVA